MVWFLCFLKVLKIVLVTFIQYVFDGISMAFNFWVVFVGCWPVLASEKKVNPPETLLETTKFKLKDQENH